MGRIIVEYDDSLIDVAGDKTIAEVFAVMAWAAKQLEWNIMVWAGEAPSTDSAVGLIAVIDPERADEYNNFTQRATTMLRAEEYDERISDLGEPSEHLRGM